jgi:hypothetical protein
MEASIDFTIAFDGPDEAGWTVARLRFPALLVKVALARTLERTFSMPFGRSSLLTRSWLAKRPARIESTCGSPPRREAPLERHLQAYCL